MSRAQPRPRTRSQIGRSAVELGKETERTLARQALRPYWPADPDDPDRGARRGRDNGSTWTPDMGDIVGTDDRLFWSVKARRDSHKPGLLAEWMAEMRTKAGVHDGAARIPVLIERRWGHADPCDWWAWLWADDLYRLMLRVTDGGWQAAIPERAARWRVRMMLRELLELLGAAGFTDTIPEVAA